MSADNSEEEQRYLDTIEAVKRRKEQTLKLITQMYDAQIDSLENRRKAQIILNGEMQTTLKSWEISDSALNDAECLVDSKYECSVPKPSDNLEKRELHKLLDRDECDSAEMEDEMETEVSYETETEEEDEEKENEKVGQKQDDGDVDDTSQIWNYQRNLENQLNISHELRSQIKPGLECSSLPIPRPVSQVSSIFESSSTASDPQNFHGHRRVKTEMEQTDVKSDSVESADRPSKKLIHLLPRWTAKERTELMKHLKKEGPFNWKNCSISGRSTRSCSSEYWRILKRKVITDTGFTLEPKLKRVKVRDRRITINVEVPGVFTKGESLEFSRPLFL